MLMVMQNSFSDIISCKAQDDQFLYVGPAIKARDLLTLLSTGSRAYEDVASNLWISCPYCMSSVVSVTCVLKTPPYRSTFSPCFTYLHIDTQLSETKSV